MSIRVCQNSFSKGILSPSLQGRVDLEQYNLGLKNLKNGLVMQEGCVVNRPGLQYLETTKYSDKKTRLIPFVFNLNESYILEFGDKYIRVIKDGAYILENDTAYEITSPYGENDIFNIDYCQQADVVTLTCNNFEPYNLSRYSNNDWRLEKINFKATIESPTNVKAKYTGSTSSNTTTYSYVVTAVHKDNFEESSKSEAVSVVGHLEAYWTTSEYITITWNTVVNACEYNIYRSVNGVYGYVGTSNTTSFKDNNIEPDLSSCAPTHTNPFENESPSCVCYFQQRKIYAASNQSPQTLWMSQTGTNDNFNVSRPLNATDSITMSIYDNTANNIQHLIPLDNLIVMTTNAEWSVNGSDGIMSASSSPYAKLQSYYGSSKIKPVVSGSMVLFVQSGGNIVRNLGYDYLSDSYDGEELTLFASHLFEGRKIIDMAYSKEPNRILWCVMDDGNLCALTYNPKQKIAAWHTHTTQGKFKSVAVIRENYEDIAYFVVEREINSKKVCYIERFYSRIVTSLENSKFLDSSISFSFEEKTNVINGLNHLKNTKVNALIDWGVVENLTVDENGTLKLPYAANNIFIGLRYDFELETLNLESQGTLGIYKTINNIEVKILNSREDFFIQNDDKTLNQNPRSHDSINNPKNLYTKDIEFCPLADRAIQKNIKIIQKYPLPLTILAINATISLEEVEAQ